MSGGGSNNGARHTPTLQQRLANRNLTPPQASPASGAVCSICSLHLSSSLPPTLPPFLPLSLCSPRAPVSSGAARAPKHSHVCRLFVCACLALSICLCLSMSVCMCGTNISIICGRLTLRLAVVWGVDGQQTLLQQQRAREEVRCPRSYPPPPLHTRTFTRTFKHSLTIHVVVLCACFFDVSMWRMHAVQNHVHQCCVCRNTCAHTRSHAHAHARTRTHTHAHACTRARAHAHARTNARILNPTHTNAGGVTGSAAAGAQPKRPAAAAAAAAAGVCVCGGAFTSVSQAQAPCATSPHMPVWLLVHI